MLRWWTNGKVETAEMFTWKCNFSLLPIYWKPPTGQSLEKNSFQLKKMFLQIPASQKIHFLCTHPRQAGSIQKWPIWNSVPRLRRRPRNAIILWPNLIHSDSNSVSEYLCLSSTRVGSVCFGQKHLIFPLRHQTISGTRVPVVNQGEPTYFWELRIPTNTNSFAMFSLQRMYKAHTILPSID